MTIRISFSVFLLTLAIGGQRATSAEIPEVATQAKAVLEKHCYACHGEDGADEGGFNYALSRDRLIGRGIVVPGNPGESQLLKQVLTGQMPKDSDPISDREKAILRSWISAGAPDFDPPTVDRPFVTNEDLLKSIRRDLEDQQRRDRRFLRYFTITHLYNAGISADELQTYRHGLSKLLNSLSWNEKVVRPISIDPLGTILRVDLRDYAWDDRTWELIIGAYPYGITFESSVATSCYEYTQCRLPYIRADWFVHACSRPPLYHDILELPGSDLELERVLWIDAARNIDQGKVIRAGFTASGVSSNNRLLERHQPPYGGAYWKSYDFAGSAEQKNLSAHPLGPGNNPEHFAHDGGEIIFNLPNGFQAYLLVDASGNRIDRGPTSIVSDPKSDDKSVINGISCMSCHARGLIDKADQIRLHVEKFAASFPRETVAEVQAIYPPAEQFSGIIQQDRARFQKALETAGVPLTQTDPVYSLARRFEGELDLILAAAEVGLTPDQFLSKLKASQDVARQLGSLANGQTIKRDTFEDRDVFSLIAKQFEIGILRPFSVPVSRPTVSLIRTTLVDKHALTKDERGDLIKEVESLKAEYGDESRVDLLDTGEIVLVTINSKEHVSVDLLRRIGKLPKLESLTLDFTNVTDVGVSELAGSKSLIHLELMSTRLTDAGLKHIGSMTNLRILQVSHTKVTGDGLKHLSPLRNLVQLQIEGTDISDDDIDELLKLPTRAKCKLWVTGGQFSQEGMKRLKKAFKDVVEIGTL